MSSPTLFVVEDDAAVASALSDVARLLELEAELYESADDFLSRYDGGRPGCLVLDYKLPGMNGVELQAKLRELNSLLPVIMISGHATVGTAVQALQLGAVTFLEKPFELNELSRHIEKALDLDRQRRQQHTQRDAALAKLAQLTKKEREVFYLVADGVTNAEIAKRLGISVRAVEDRRARMMKRLGADNLEQVIRLGKTLLPNQDD